MLAGEAAEAGEMGEAMKSLPRGLLLSAVLCSCASSSSDQEWTSRGSALTAEECTSFAGQNGKVAICHATNSVKNPFVAIQPDVNGCINGHSNHPLDFIDFTGDCSVTCLPQGAPCIIEQTPSCCAGFFCIPGSGGSFCQVPGA